MTPSETIARLRREAVEAAARLAELHEQLRRAEALERDDAVPTDTRARLDARDNAIRQTIASFYSGQTPSRAAKNLARDLHRLLTGGPIKGVELRAALHRVVALNQNNTIGWRQILNVIDGDRGRPTLQHSRS
jgi:hypothetical protein